MKLAGPSGGSDQDSRGRALRIDERCRSVHMDVGLYRGYRKANVLDLGNSGPDFDEAVIRAEAGLAHAKLVRAEGKELDSQPAVRIAEKDVVVFVGGGCDLDGGTDGGAGGIGNIKAQLTVHGLRERGRQASKRIAARYARTRDAIRNKIRENPRNTPIWLDDNGGDREAGRVAALIGVRAKNGGETRRAGCVRMLKVSVDRRPSLGYDSAGKGKAC